MELTQAQLFWVIVGVVAFVVFLGLLVAWALTSKRSPPVQLDPVDDSVWDPVVEVTEKVDTDVLTINNNFDDNFINNSDSHVEQAQKQFLENPDAFDFKHMITQNKKMGVTNKTKHSDEVDSIETYDIWQGIDFTD